MLRGLYTLFYDWIYSFGYIDRDIPLHISTQKEISPEVSSKKPFVYSWYMTSVVFRETLAVASEAERASCTWSRTICRHVNWQGFRRLLSRKHSRIHNCDFVACKRSKLWPHDFFTAKWETLLWQTNKEEEEVCYHCVRFMNRKSRLLQKLRKVLRLASMDSGVGFGFSDPEQ